MNVSVNDGNIIAENENGHILFGFTTPIVDSNKYKNDLTKTLAITRIKNDDTDSFLQFSCYGTGLLISKHEAKQYDYETEIEAYSLLINNNGVLSINVKTDAKSYAIWDRDELVTNMDENAVLEIFTDEKILAIINYYSIIYPDMLESVVELTQSIVSKTQEDALNRKRYK